MEVLVAYHIIMDINIQIQQGASIMKTLSLQLFKDQMVVHKIVLQKGHFYLIFSMS